MPYGMLWKLFFLFFKINLFTTSGPASYGLAEKILVPDVIDERAFQRIVAISANIPGSDAIQLAWQVGFHASSVRGAVVAVAGALTPCILLVSAVMVGLRFVPPSVLDRFFTGIKPILFLLLLLTAVNIFGTGGTVNPKSLVILVCGGILLYFKIPVVVIMLIAGLVSVAI